MFGDVCVFLEGARFKTNLERDPPNIMFGAPTILTHTHAFRLARIHGLQDGVARRVVFPSGVLPGFSRVLPARRSGLIRLEPLQNMNTKS